jgi:hypothetical protein
VATAVVPAARLARQPTRNDSEDLGEWPPFRELTLLGVSASGVEIWGSLSKAWAVTIVRDAHSLHYGQVSHQDEQLDSLSSLPLSSYRPFPEPTPDVTPWHILTAVRVRCTLSLVIRVGNIVAESMAVLYCRTHHNASQADSTFDHAVEVDGKRSTRCGVELVLHVIGEYSDISTRPV